MVPSTIGTHYSGTLHPTHYRIQEHITVGTYSQALGTTCCACACTHQTRCRIINHHEIIRKLHLFGGEGHTRKAQLSRYVHASELHVYGYQLHGPDTPGEGRGGEGREGEGRGGEGRGGEGREGEGRGGEGREGEGRGGEGRGGKGRGGEGRGGKGKGGEGREEGRGEGREREEGRGERRGEGGGERGEGRGEERGGERSK